MLLAIYMVKSRGYLNMCFYCKRYSFCYRQYFQNKPVNTTVRLHISHPRGISKHVLNCNAKIVLNEIIEIFQKEKKYPSG